MEDLILPNFLKMTQEELEEEHNQTIKEREKAIELYKRWAQEECDLIEQKKEELKQIADENQNIKHETIRVKEKKKNLQKEFAELELTVKDVQEEIILAKSQCNQIEVHIHEKSEQLNTYAQDIAAEKTRIEGIVEKIKAKYKYTKSTLGLFERLFNCSLTCENEQQQVYCLVLKNHSGRDEVSVKFQMENSNNYDTKLPHFLLLDITSSPQMEPEFFKTIQDVFNNSQDSQGLLTFLHSNYISVESKGKI
ncbi:hypothetical protein WDU94_013399 [Cyamophila willieti]